MKAGGTNIVPGTYSISTGTPCDCRAWVRPFQYGMTTISSRAKALRPASAFSTISGWFFFISSTRKADTGIDIVLVAAECLIQHLKPGIADLAIGRNADPPLSISD